MNELGEFLMNYPQVQPAVAFGVSAVLGGLERLARHATKKWGIDQRFNPVGGIVIGVVESMQFNSSPEMYLINPAAGLAGSYCGHKLTNYVIQKLNGPEEKQE